MATNAFAAGTYSAVQSLGAGPRLAPGPKPAGGLDFGALLQNAVDGAARAGKAAESQAIAASVGKADVVDVVTAVAESESALETLVAVRDRVIAAYEDIMRMPV